VREVFKRVDSYNPKLKLRTKLMVLTGLLVSLIILLVMVLVSQNTRRLILEETRTRGIAIGETLRSH